MSGVEPLIGEAEQASLMPYLIDSDVLIDISPGSEAAGAYLDALPEGWAISQISALELIVGARDNRDLSDIDTFLSA